MKFAKVEGLGNDFILINTLTEQVPADPAAFAQKYCNRFFGIGADGVILIRPSKIADMRMQIINSDGSEAEMCGNGIRCFAKYLYDNGIVPHTKMTVETLAGIIKPEIIVGNDGKAESVNVDMGLPILKGELIPTTFKKEQVVAEKIMIEGREFTVTCISMGNPHCVIFTDDLSDEMLKTWGPRLEKAEYFPKKTNVEFVKIISPTEACMRVWERGAAVTMACGTGASATMTACVLNNLTEKAITLHLDGGDLMMSMHENGHIFMRGTANSVYEGWLDI